MRQSRQGSGTAKAPKTLQQSVIVKVDRTKYNRLQIKLIQESKHGEPKKTVASFFRDAIEKYLE